MTRLALGVVALRVVPEVELDVSTAVASHSEPASVEVAPSTVVSVLPPPLVGVGEDVQAVELAALVSISVRS